MRDGSIMRCMSMATIGVCYACYLVFTPNPADGILFAGVCTALGLLAGIDIGVSFKR